MAKKKWYDSVINHIPVKMDGIGNYFDQQGNKIDPLLLFPNKSISDFDENSLLKKEGKIIPLRPSSPWSSNNNNDAS